MATSGFMPAPGAESGASSSSPPRGDRVDAARAAATPTGDQSEVGDQTVAITRKFTEEVNSEPSIKTGGDYTLPHPVCARSGLASTVHSSLIGRLFLSDWL
jgi:hypothetical protein